MVKVNGLFLNYNRMGEKLAQKICEGWKVTTIIQDRFGNGMFLFEHPQACTTFVPFTEINVNDTVTIEFQKLGEIKREY